MTRLQRWVSCAAALAGLWLAPALAQPTRQLTPVQAPPEPPILRIEAEFHTQVVNRFAQDRGGRIVVTASDDKTIRIWQASDGAALATLRVPIASGDEGAIYAVAISPDGKTLLAGGSTGFAWDRAFALYMFDLESQRLRGRLPNLPGPINHLAYAPDGTSFAIAMGNGGGVWLVDANDGHLIGSDQGFTQRATWVDFDRRGRLFATGFDGEVRLYDASGHRIAHRAPVAGARPYAVAVSPDGRTVAVGYADQPRVELLNAQDLSARASLTTNPAGARESGAGGLGSVAWGEDGALFAAGSLRGRDGRMVVRRWGAGGTGRPTDWSGLRDTVFQLGAAADGGVLLVGADPALVRMDRAGRVVFRKEGPGLDFRDMEDRLFRVSYDGLSVQLQTKTMAEPWLVDMGQRAVGPRTATRALTPVAAPTVARLIASGPAPEVSGWRNSTNPKIGGQRIRLDAEEWSRSYAATPSGELVVLGTDYQLRVFRRDGVATDAAELPGAAWAVGVSGDGRTVVAAVGDGTLRWFGLSEAGRLTPRASLFIAADGRRWVAWTPSGFFDYSDTGGEGLVGVVLNQARNQVPEWFSFAQVYRRYYAPDTVAARLRGQDVPDPAAGLEGLRQTLAKTPPPSIELGAVCWTVASRQACQKLAATPISRSLMTKGMDSTDVTVPAEVGSVTLQFRLRGEGVAASTVDLFVNGRNAGRAVRQVSATGDSLVEQPAALDTGVNRVQVRAYDREQQTYTQSRVLLVAREAPPQARPAKPSLYVLAVGINKYAATINGLSFAVPDARSVAAAIRAHVPESYGAVEMIELYDEAASTRGVLQALGSIGARAGAGDTVLIYLSGHGTTIGKQYYFVTQNVASVDDVATAGLSEEALVHALAGIKAKNAMMFLDTCHAGAFSLDAASQIAHETGRYVLAASASLEEALDSYDDRNGVFATAVLRGLAGQAASGKDVVNNFDLGLYVTPLVRVLANERRHGQSARFKIAADDAEPFPIVEVRSGGVPVR
ncbi:MAG TPA: caspase family protein [Acetobacteraceae bacterium]|nr:caspase family protein [Acetobacteraceae bacterium]